MQPRLDLPTSVTNLLPKDGEVFMLSETIAVDYENLREALAWKHEKIRMFGRWVLQPRLTAWYGDEGTEYTYSGLLNKPSPWTESLLQIKGQVEELAQTMFNSALANYYRDGKDSMGWHQDNEPELGANPVIASVSLGATRRFQLRHKFDKRIKKLCLDLEHGSLLIMQGTTQNFWQHQVPKTTREVGGRINLTFRKLQT